MLLRSRTALTWSIALAFFTLLLLFLRYSGHATLERLRQLHSGAQPATAPLTSNSKPADLNKPIISEAASSLQCPQQVEWIDELRGSPDVTFPLMFARRDIIVRDTPSAPPRPSLTKVKDRLLPDFQRLEKAEDGHLVQGQHCLSPLTLSVSLPPRIDASHMMFGTATTLDRLEASIPQFQRWLAYSGAQIVIIVKGPDETDPDKARMTQMEDKLRNVGIDATVIPPLSNEDISIQRYASLIKAMHNRRERHTTWFGFIDDDTFVTSMSTLLGRLAEYDASKQWYLGALSEEWWTVVAYGRIAMGGGGIFLSAPLMDVLAANYERCRAHAVLRFGDHRVSECIALTTDTPFTFLQGLYQIDVHGDRSGIFESGREMMTMHHWKEGFWSEDGSGADGIRHARWFPMPAMSLVTDVCGDRCMFQRWQMGTDTVLSNGYSISVYPKRRQLNKLEMFKAEKTWSDTKWIENTQNSGWDHYLGPMRPALNLTSEKIQYRFMDARKLPNGAVRQYYRRLAQLPGEIDAVVELTWQFDNSTAGSN